MMRLLFAAFAGVLLASETVVAGWSPEVCETVRLEKAKQAFRVFSDRLPTASVTVESRCSDGVCALQFLHLGKILKNSNVKIDQEIKVCWSDGYSSSGNENVCGGSYGGFDTSFYIYKDPNKSQAVEKFLRITLAWVFDGAARAGECLERHGGIELGEGRTTYQPTAAWVVEPFLITLWEFPDLRF